MQEAFDHNPEGFVYLITCDLTLEEKELRNHYEKIYSVSSVFLQVLESKDAKMNKINSQDSAIILFSGI